MDTTDAKVKRDPDGALPVGTVVLIRNFVMYGALAGSKATITSKGSFMLCRRAYYLDNDHRAIWREGDFESIISQPKE